MIYLLWFLIDQRVEIPDQQFQKRCVGNDDGSLDISIKMTFQASNIKMPARHPGQGLLVACRAFKSMKGRDGNLPEMKYRGLTHHTHLAYSQGRCQRSRDSEAYLSCKLLLESHHQMKWRLHAKSMPGSDEMSDKAKILHLKNMAASR